MLLTTTDASLLPLTAALRRLERLQFLNVRAAVTQLRLRLDLVRMACLYQKYFPAEYAASQPAIYPRPDEVYSQAELEFVKLVDQHLFPLDMAVYDFGPEEGDRFGNIPFCSQAIDDQDVSLEEWRPALRLVYMLWHSLDPGNEEGWRLLLDDTGRQAEIPLPRFVSEPEQNCILDIDRFAAGCRELGRPLSAVRALLKMLDYSTGTCWLDVGDEMFWSSPEQLEWDAATIDWLHREWKVAQKIGEACEAILEWLEDDPERMAEFVRLWNDSLVAVPPDRQW
jgi:hypothetical protein